MKLKDYMQNESKLGTSGQKVQARKLLNSLKSKLKKYPDMPQEIKDSINQMISFYEKELKTYTHDDVFPKE